MANRFNLSVLMSIQVTHIRTGTGKELFIKIDCTYGTSVGVCIFGAKVYGCKQAINQVGWVHVLPCILCCIDI